MPTSYLDIATTPAVRAAQDAQGSGDLWRRAGGRPADAFTPREAAFIARRDSFYLATVSETGWPYVQHRGGPPGFLKGVDDRTLACADFRGNRQYISLGNLAGESRVALFLMDYAAPARLKIYGRMTIVAPEDDPRLAQAVALPAYRAHVERILVVRLDAYDWNCPQHITRRFAEADIVDMMRPLHDRLAALEAENARLRAALES